MRGEKQRHIDTERPRGLLRRAADGRLRPATEEAEVADIWAEQKRIQLAAAIQREKAKVAKKQRRRERELFGKHRVARGQETVVGRPIEIKISVPKLDMANMLRRIRLPNFSRRRWVWVVAGFVLVVFIFATQDVYNKPSGATQKTAVSNSVVAGASTTPAGGVVQPDYATVLPTGKTIEQLGGWGRVSPPGNDPVFGYSDALGGVHIVVSEQPLPDIFKNDLHAQLPKLAKQLAATEKLSTTDGEEAYLGTAANGAQSLVANKGELLILIRSTSRISNQLWADYVSTLQ